MYEEKGETLRKEARVVEPGRVGRWPNSTSAVYSPPSDRLSSSSSMTTPSEAALVVGAMCG